MTYISMPDCKCCGIDKPEDAFCFRNRALGLRKTECRECRSKKSIPYRTRPDIRERHAAYHRERVAKSSDAHRAAQKEYFAGWHLKNKDRRNVAATANYVRHINEQPETVMVSRIRARAKAAGVPFDLTVSDLPIPDACPVLGVALDHSYHGAKGPRQNSPSVDRIVPELGYVSGNVRVMSHRANTLLNNASLEEMEKVLTFLRANPRRAA